MRKPKPLEENQNFQRLARFLEGKDWTWPREIARQTGLDSRSVQYYIDLYPEIFEVNDIPGRKKTVMKLVRLRGGALSANWQLARKIIREME